MLAGSRRDGLNARRTHGYGRCRVRPIHVDRGAARRHHIIHHHDNDNNHRSDNNDNLNTDDEALDDHHAADDDNLHPRHTAGQ